MKLDRDTMYLLRCVLLRSFGFALGRSITASYSSSILARHSECSLHRFACGFCVIEASWPLPLLFSRSYVGSTTRDKGNKKTFFWEFKELCSHSQSSLLNIRTDNGVTQQRDGRTVLRVEDLEESPCKICYIRDDHMNVKPTGNMLPNVIKN